MPCEPFATADGSISGWVCSRGRRATPACKCGRRPAPLLCDHPLTGAKAGQTCDRPLCVSCAVETAPDRHLCPAHARMAGGR